MKRLQPKASTSAFGCLVSFRLVHSLTWVLATVWPHSAFPLRKFSSRVTPGKCCYYFLGAFFLETWHYNNVGFLKVKYKKAFCLLGVCQLHCFSLCLSFVSEEGCPWSYSMDYSFLTCISTKLHIGRGSQCKEVEELRGKAVINFYTLREF